MAPPPVRAQSVPPAAPQPAPARTDPIIPDDQFNDALPSLDPALEQPLEPLDPLPAPGEPPVVTPPFPPVPGPVEDVPLGDPELAQPLPPLEGFDVLPTTVAEAAPAEESPRVRYTLNVTGLREIDLEGRFRDLSALEDARGEAVNGAMIEARAREDADLAVRLLRSEGYYDAVATHAITPAAGPDGGLVVAINALPGERYLFGTIEVTGTDPYSDPVARIALQLEEDTPIVAALVEAAEANVLLRLPQEGFPFAAIATRDILLDPDTHRGDYTLPIQPGPRASFRNILTSGEDQAFDQRHIQRLARFGRDDLYDRRMVDDLREAMVATRLFSTVAAEPIRTGETAPDGTEYVDIMVTQDAGPARSLDASIGYSTGEGFRIVGAWEHRNLFRPEGGFRVAAVLGTNEQSAVARLRFNNWRLRDQALLFQVEAGRRDYAAFEGYTTRLLGLVSRESTPIWQKRWTYSYGLELLATNESQVGAPRLSLGDAYYIGGLIGSIGYDRSNSLLDPSRGFRLGLRLNPEASLRDGSEYYLRSQIDASAYYPFGDFVLAGRARFGSIFGIERDRLAPSRRFYAGGGGSVRGFGFQELGPRTIVPNPDFDPDVEGSPQTLSIPNGGRGLAEFAVEGRYRFGNYGVVAFVDAGTVSESEYPDFRDMRFGVGVGGRLYTNFGPIRVDVATPINRREGESWISLYISIGQAF